MPTRAIPHGTPNGYSHHLCRCDDCRAAYAAYHGALNGESNGARDALGCIVTLRQRETGRLLTKNVHGKSSTALPAFLDHYDPRVWQVVCISSPRTILADLRGRSASNGTRSTWDGVTSEGMDTIRLPEPQTLTRIGRSDYA